MYPRVNKLYSRNRKMYLDTNTPNDEYIHMMHNGQTVLVMQDGPHSTSFISQLVCLERNLVV